MSWRTDPFLYLGIAVFIVHFISYYNLLDKISSNIKQRKNTEFDNIKSKISSKATPDDIVLLHKELHRTEELYDNLESKVYTNFNYGWILIALSAIGFLRNFVSSFITSDVVNIIIIFMAYVSALFCATLWRLLYWNLFKK